MCGFGSEWGCCYVGLFRDLYPAFRGRVILTPLHFLLDSRVARPLHYYTWLRSAYVISLPPLPSCMTGLQITYDIAPPPKKK